MNSPAASGFLVRLPIGAAAGPHQACERACGHAALDLNWSRCSTCGSAACLREPASPRELAPPVWEWHRATPAGVADSPNPWDIAHALNSQLGLAAAGAPVVVEPDYVQEWPYENPIVRDSDAPLAAAGALCVFNDQVPELPHVDKTFAWHLDDDRTQLRRARSLAAPPRIRIRIAHLDTGYDPNHVTFPAHFANQVRLDLQRNFVDDQPANDGTIRRRAAC